MSKIESDMTESLHHGKAMGQSAANAASAVKETVSRHVSDVADRAKDAGKQTANFVREEYDQLSDAAHHAYHSARDTAYDIEQSAEYFVQRRPLRMLLIAGAIGLAVGLLWKRR